MKDKEIEEMVNIACEVVKDDCIIHCNYPPCNQCKNIAEAYYNAGYRKLDDHEIVISKDEYNRLNDTINMRKIRKETAREILLMFDDRNYITEKDLKNAIAKKFGVEVE